MGYAKNWQYQGLNVMTTHFITAEIDLQASATELQTAITAELQKQGEPLRWAITSINEDQQKALVEAVVTKTAEL